jgi:subtilisin family serine protease
MVTLFVCLLGTSLLAAGMAAAQPAEIQGVAAVRGALARKGRVSIIAELKPGSAGTLSARAITNARAGIARQLAAAGVRNVRDLGSLPYVALEVTARQLDALLATGLVRGVGENGEVHATLMDSVPLVGGPAAWALGARGAGKAVVVVDSGVESSHPFFGGRVVRGVCSATDCGTTIVDRPGAGEPNPGCYHGTHVAGIAAGKGASVAGVAPDASLISLRVFECNSVPWDYLIRGLDYVFTTLRFDYDIASVNMSMGNGAEYGSDCDGANVTYQAVAAAIDQLRGAGIATVVATGNEGHRAGISAPACIGNAVAVGSTTKSDALSSFSNSGPNVDVLAPGSSIYSSLLGGSFGWLSGTSMATPHVAGAFAAIRSKLPSATVSQIEQALETTGTAVGDGAGTTRRRIDVAAALRALGVDPGPAWHPWESFSGALLTSPECLSLAATETHCWAKLASGALGWWRYDGTARPAAVSLGGTVSTSPSCLQAGGKLHCFVQLASNQLGQITRTGASWGTWRSLGDNIRRRPACVSVDGTRITCVALSATNKLRSRSWSGTSWGAWSTVAASVTAADAPTCWVRAGGIDCVVVDSAGGLRYVRRGSAGSWAAPQNLGGASVGLASCVAHSTTTRTCFLRGTADTLRRIHFNGTRWAAWEDLGGKLATAPSCTQLDGVQPNCFAVAADGTLVHRRKTSAGWQPWANLGGALNVSRPACVAPTGVRMDCFSRGSANALAHRAYF